MLWNRKDMYETFYKKTSNKTQAMDCVGLVRSDKELMRIWRKSKDIYYFLSDVLNSDDDIKFSDFALFYYGTVEPTGAWYYRREFCDKFANEFFKTTSDVGALKIGCNGLDVLVGNHYGDGINRVALFDGCHESAVSSLFPHSDVTLRGQDIKVYAYDCGNDVAITLSGAWHVYSDERFFALVKWA